MNLAGFGCPKVCKKILCLHSPILKVQSAKRSGPLRFSEIGTEVVCEQKFPSVDPGSVFKDYDVHHVQSLQEKTEVLNSLSLKYLQGCVFLNSASFANNYCDVNIVVNSGK